MEKSSWDWQVKELDVRNNVRKNFYSFQGAKIKLKLSRDILKISEESTKTVKLLIKAGETKKSQLLQAEIQANRSLMAVRNQEQNLQATQRVLVSSVGVPGIERENIVGTLPEEFSVYEWDVLYENMIRSHPSIQSALSQMQSANWAVRRAEAEPIPDIQTQLGLLYDTSTLDTVLGIQVGGALPVHNKNKGNIRSRCADYMKAVQEIERIKLELTSQLAQAYNQYESNRIQSVKFREEILPKAKESLILSSKGFEQGQDPYIQLLIAQRTYFESNQEYIDILVNANQGLADLQKLKSVE